MLEFLIFYIIFSGFVTISFYFEDNVKWYWKCNCCGSIVIHFDNGTIKSVTQQYIKDNNIDLTNAVKLVNSYHCEKCFPMERVCECIMK